jgi:hypothetical protein
MAESNPLSCISKPLVYEPATKTPSPALESRQRRLRLEIARVHDRVLERPLDVEVTRRWRHIVGQGLEQIVPARPADPHGELARRPFDQLIDRGPVAPAWREQARIRVDVRRGGHVLESREHVAKRSGLEQAYGLPRRRGEHHPLEPLSPRRARHHEAPGVSRDRLDGAAVTKRGLTQRRGQRGEVRAHPAGELERAELPAEARRLPERVERRRAQRHVLDVVEDGAAEHVEERMDDVSRDRPREAQLAREIPDRQRPVSRSLDLRRESERPTDMEEPLEHARIGQAWPLPEALAVGWQARQQRARQVATEEGQRAERRPTSETEHAQEPQKPGIQLGGEKLSAEIHRHGLRTALQVNRVGRAPESFGLLEEHHLVLAVEHPRSGEPRYSAADDRDLHAAFLS